MRVRRRSISEVTQRGYQTNLRFGGTSELSMTQTSTCEDVVGNREDANYLSVEHRRYATVGAISGHAAAFPVYHYDNYPYFSQNSWNHVSPSMPAPSLDEAITSVAAQTNPAKPTVSVPVFLAELPDAIDMLHQKGKSLHFVDPTGNAYSRTKGRLGNQNSGVEGTFGWLPLINDIVQILNFTNDVDKRVKQLTAANGVGGSTGSRTVWRDRSFLSIPNVEVWSLEGTVTVDVTYTTTRHMWASINWHANHPGLPDPAETLQQARLAVHGWRLAPADAWELIPWSWLVDYFTNFGQYLEATQGGLDISPRRGCVMIETTTHISHILKSASSFTVTPMHAIYTSKERFPRMPTPTLRSVPLLGPQQLLTLSSIAFNLDKLRTT